MVSNVSLGEFNENILEKKMTDMIWIASIAKKHEEITEFVMTNSMQGISPGQYIPVVPLRLCTIYRNQETLFKRILPYKQKIINFLDYSVDKAEWSVKIFCDKRVFMGSRDKKKEQSVLSGRESLLPGEGYLLAKKMNRIHEEAFTADIQKILEDIHSLLSSHIDRYQFLRCMGKKVHGRLHDMIMNVAFLIGRHKLDRFKETLNALMKRYKNEGLIFEFSGPWPPYNFCPEL